MRSIASSGSCSNANAPVVADGVEFYDIDAHGDVVADVDVAVVRAATAV